MGKDVVDDCGVGESRRDGHESAHIRLTPGNNEMTSEPVEVCPSLLKVDAGRNESYPRVAFRLEIKDSA